MTGSHGAQWPRECLPQPPGSPTRAKQVVVLADRMTWANRPQVIPPGARSTLARAEVAHRGARIEHDAEPRARRPSAQLPLVPEASAHEALVKSANLDQQLSAQREIAANELVGDLRYRRTELKLTPYQGCGDFARLNHLARHDRAWRSTMRLDVRPYEVGHRNNIVVAEQDDLARRRTKSVVHGARNGG